MCGRFAIYADPNVVIKKFNIAKINGDLIPSYNVVPSQRIAVVLQPEGYDERILTGMRWGLIPSWHKSSQKLRMNNCARLESVDTKPSFKQPFFRKRCLILADGFFEWNQETKQPYYIQLKDKTTFGMAGIWGKWSDGEKSIESCCIITQNPNKIIEACHDRMPAIVPEKNIDAWLTLKTDNAEELKQLLEPLIDEDTLLHPVTKSMNTPKFNNVEAIRDISL